MPYVSVRPYARSNMSISSSVIASSFSNMWSSKIKWQVEQANVPSHAPEENSKVTESSYSKLPYFRRIFIYVSATKVKRGIDRQIMRTIQESTALLHFITVSIALKASRDAVLEDPVSCLQVHKNKHGKRI